MAPTYLPHDPLFVQVDPIHRLSLVKMPITTAHGLVLSLALHNDLGTRIARDNLTVTIGWTFRDGTAPGQYVLGGKGAAQGNKWTQTGVSISQFDVSRIVVPLVRRGTVLGASARGVPGGRKAGVGAGDVELDPPLPLASLAITAAPSPLVAVSQLWDAAHPAHEAPLDWIMPLRIQLPANGPPVLSRPIALSLGSTPPSPMLWISEPSAFDHKPLGSSVWDAALVLAGYLSSMVTPTTTVVELGAGCGFLGQVLAAHPHAPKRAVLTDLPEVVAPYMRDNTRGLANVTCAAYCWGDPWPADLVPERDAGDLGANVVVVGSDITYNEALYPLLLTTLVEMRTKWPQARVVVAFKRRSSEGEEEFLVQFNNKVVRGLNDAARQDVGWGMEVRARTAGQVYVVEAGPV